MTILLAALAALLIGPQAEAGVFDLPSFVNPGQYSVGLEPEVAISNGTGAALNLKPRIGHTDFLSWEGLIGTGSGSRKFRIGLTADFDWFPDVDAQPGIATPLYMEYYRIDTDGLFTFGAKPMVYKTFKGKEASYIPFLAVPLGWGLRNSTLQGTVQVALGSMFQFPNSDHWRFTAEVGFNAANSYSYISGGVTYYH